MVELFLKKILLIRVGPLGKIKRYAVRVEFPFGSAPHIYSFFWIPDKPTLNESSVNEYVNF